MVTKALKIAYRLIFKYLNPFFHFSFKNSSYIISPHGPRGAWIRYPRIHYILKGEYPEKNNDGIMYDQWIELYSKLNDAKELKIKESIQGFSEKPKISIILPVYNPNIIWLKEAIDSVRFQLYPNWELCIADDCSTNQEVRDTIAEYAESDSRVKFVFREINGHISAASNSALLLATADWVALLDQDDLLSEDALYHVAKAILDNPSAKIIYSDEDKTDEFGKRFDPHFKPKWNYELFKSYNFISHLGVYHKPTLVEVGRFQLGLEGAQDYDLVLRILEYSANSVPYHIPRILYHWRSHSTSTASDTNIKSYVPNATKIALDSHFKRVNIPASTEIDRSGATRIRYSSYEKEPLVSIIILSHYKNHLMRKCIISIIKKTKYTNYEIIVIDNTPDDSECCRLIEKLKNKKPNLKYIRYNCEFNYSKINNFAVKHSLGEIICFLNNDTEVITPDWLCEMVSHANRPDVGAVGCLLLYPNNLVQHAGIIMGIQHRVGHAFKYFHYQDRGYMSRMCVVQSYSAVTGACLVVNRKKFNLVGGFDEINLPVAFNDVDLCLKLMNIGYNNVWTPFAKLYHHEGASRGVDESLSKNERYSQELNIIRSKYPELFHADPFYNPNLSLNSEDFALASPPRVEFI